MKFATRCIAEPNLEFGDGGQFIDPRIGLIRHGPLQPKAGDVVRVGVVGTSETVEGIAGYPSRASQAVPCAQSSGASVPHARSAFTGALSP